MATNLAIDPDLLDRAFEVSGERTKAAAVTRALEEFVARREQTRLLDLIGTLEWDESFTWPNARATKPWPRPIASPPTAPAPLRSDPA